MVQIIWYVMFLSAGALAVMLFFSTRLKIVSIELNKKIDRLIQAFAPGKVVNVGVITNASGSLKDLSSIGDRIDSLASLSRDAAAIPDESSAPKVMQSDLQKRFDNLRIVNELGQVVTSSLKLDDTFLHLFDCVNSVMDAAVFELGIFTWRDNNFRILSNLPIEDESAYKNHMAEWSLKNNREVILEDAENDYERYVFKPLVISDGRIPKSVIVFPVYRNDTEVGTISVMSFNKNAFNEYHIEMVRSLIPYTAVAIGNALIHQELIDTQSQLVHNEKMASLGQMASGIAHEILNPINFVNNFSIASKELIPEIESSVSKEEELELKTQLVGNLDRIHFHGQRAYTIVKNMMLLSRTGTGAKTSVNAGSAVTTFLEIALNGFTNKVNGFECRVEKSLDPDLPAIEIIEEDLGRVLLNLYSNAFYTMNEKIRKISLLPDASSLVQYEPVLTVKSALVNSHVVISVSDNGLGIPDEILGKIFLPFFTTKPTGDGTGLGLSISHDIITKGNGGEFTVKSVVGKGSEFRISLPLKSIN